MKKLALILVVSMGICSGASHADELDDAYAACATYANRLDQFFLNRQLGPADRQALLLPEFREPFTKSCPPIREAYVNRQKAKKEADEAQNPDLAKVNALAKKLQGVAQ